MGGWYKHYFKVRLMTLVKQPLFSDRDSVLSIHGLSPHGRNVSRKLVILSGFQLLGSR